MSNEVNPVSNTTLIMQVAGVVVKDRETEAAMCADLALLGGVCLIAKR
jgi:hypothetical protein